MNFYGKIENPANLPDNCQAIKKIVLLSGETISAPVYLMGGGQVHKKYFIKALNNKKYENALEWCAGHGEIGFELLTNLTTKTLTFSDIHPDSKLWCLKNANELGYAHLIESYISPTIADIPVKQKWDLVVGNPPNSLDPDRYILERAKKENWTEDHILLFARTTWDNAGQLHKEFFQNIKFRITPDADIFITVHDTVLSTINKMAESNEFKIEKIHNMFPDPYPKYIVFDTSSPIDPALKIVHFKQKS